MVARIKKQFSLLAGVALLGLASCAESAIDDALDDFDLFDSTVPLEEAGAEGGSGDVPDADLGFPDASSMDASTLPDGGLPDASSGGDGGPHDGGSDGGPRDAGKPDASAPDAGKPDASTCSASNCSNSCSIGSTRCCKDDNTCGCALLGFLECN